jgi:hypothetical protein
VIAIAAVGAVDVCGNHGFGPGRLLMTLFLLA